MQDMTVTADELIAAYKQNLSDAAHQIIMMQVAYDKMKVELEKAQARNRDLESAFGTAAASAREELSDRPKRPQVAREVAPGLNGAEKSVEPS